MKTVKKHIGMGLIVLGVVLLVVLHLLHLTFLNTLLSVPLLLVLTGCFLHVRFQKHESSY